MKEENTTNIVNLLVNIMERLINPTYVPENAMNRFCADCSIVLCEVYLAVKAIGVNSGIAKAALLKTLIELCADLNLMAKSEDRNSLVTSYAKIDGKDWSKLVRNIEAKQKGKEMSKDFRPYNSNGRWQGNKTTLQRITDIDDGTYALHIYDLVNTMTHINPNGGSIRGAIAQGNGLLDYFNHFTLVSLQMIYDLGFFTESEAEEFNSLVC